MVDDGVGEALGVMEAVLSPHCHRSRPTRRLVTQMSRRLLLFFFSRLPPLLPPLVHRRWRHPVDIEFERVGERVQELEER